MPHITARPSVLVPRWRSRRADHARVSFPTTTPNLPTDIAATGLPGAGNGSLYNHYNSWSVTGTVNYALPWADLTSVNNFNYNRNAQLQENSFESPATNPPAGWATEFARWQGLSSEDRALTKFDFPLNALFGVYYQKTNLSSISGRSSLARRTRRRRCRLNMLQLKRIRSHTARPCRLTSRLFGKSSRRWS